MPAIGEIQRGTVIGSKSLHQQYIWVACRGCGKGRWVALIGGKARSELCISCARKQNSRVTGRVRQNGYIKIKLQPDDFFYPMADKKGYVLEHRLVMAKHLGRCLLPWEIPHHKTGITKDDNRIEGLELITDKRFHMVDSATKLHIKQLGDKIRKLEAEILKKKDYVKIDRDADLVSEISLNLGSLQAKIGNLFENYPTNFNLIMKQLCTILNEAGWIKEVKDAKQQR